MLSFTEFLVPLYEYLDFDFEIYVKLGFYREKILTFEIGLWAIGDDGTRYEVASVDCCDSEVHVHRMRRSEPGERQRHRKLVVELSAGDEAVVDRYADLMQDWMHKQWQALARSWNDV